MTDRDKENQPLFDHLDGDEPQVDLSGCDPEQTADHLFLDGLLRELHTSETDATRTRVERAMARLGRPRLGRIHTQRYSAVAAALLVCAGALWMLLGVAPPTAFAALTRALESAQVAADRLYRVVVERRLPGPARMEASLYVNGGRKFVVEIPNMPAGTLWAGGDGETVWLVPAFKPFPVLVSSDPGLMNSLMRSWMEKQDVQLPFLQITKVLENMQRAYDIDFLETEEIPADTLSVIGRRRTDDPLLPARIRLLAHADSGTVRELVLEWNTDGNRPTPGSMTFTLISEQRRPPDWYAHTAHHSSIRHLKRL